MSRVAIDSASINKIVRPMHLREEVGLGAASAVALVSRLLYKNPVVLDLQKEL